MEHQSDEDTASTTIASSQKKYQPQNQSLSERMAKHWPFTRVDPKLLELAHKQYQTEKLNNAEEAPF